jgi:uncharacterized membrane protein YphA (DoxX/SURF4 family)
MIQEFKQRQFPAGNPLANVLVILVGALVIGVSFVLGVVALVALVAAAVVLAAIIGVRVWWLNRKIGTRRKNHVNQPGQTATSARIIEGEFREVGQDKDRDASR